MTRWLKPGRAGAAPAGASDRPVRDGTQALSLHIGLNGVDPNAYAGWSGELCACEADARVLAAAASRQGFAARILLTQRATRRAVLGQVRQAARRLEAGGFFWISFSGHGGQVPDRNGDELDKLDETWCLHDGQLIDDELTTELAGFRRGVRVLVTTDCCHGGTVVRAPRSGATRATRVRMMPPSVAQRTYAAHRAFYDRLQRRSGWQAAPADPDAALARVAALSPTTPPPTSFGAAVILLAGCQDNQSVEETDEHGLFTERLLRVWNDGRFLGGYRKFHSVLKAAMPATQTPKLSTLGECGRFLAERPLRVGHAAAGRSERA